MARARTRISAEDRRQQIIEVALELFARQGFKGTTTRQIAQRARVNEALIFRHFPHKEALYWAVIADKCRRTKGREELRRKLEGTQDTREIFTWLAGEVLRRNREDTGRSRLLLFSALENHSLSQRFFRTHLAGYYELLADYIRARIREGVFRDVDPALAARGFLGMLFYHFLIQELFGGKRYHHFDPEKVGAVLSDIWLEGMLAANGRGARRFAETP